jgi:signal transduction histidine kinase/ActR/RegA family two-component response regulator
VCPTSRSADACCLAPGDARPQNGTARRRGEGERAEGLERVVRVLTESFDVSELAQRITESMVPLFRAESSSAWLRQRDGSMACVAMAGRGAESLTIGEAAGDGPSAVLAVPLIFKDEVVGALVTGHAERRGLAQTEIDLLQAFADQVTPAMRNVQLFAHAQAARAEAEAAYRARDEFVGLLAHELRNSLAPIDTAAALILRAGPAIGVVQDPASIVKRQARHLARLLDDLLDASHTLRGGIELKQEPISLAVAVEEAVEAMRPLADLAGLTICLSLPAAPLCVEADSTRLGQIIVNILSNAVKYTPAGGRIEVTATAEDGEAVLRVRDDGIGILPEMLTHVFDFFFRSDRARLHTPNGQGVGLALVRQLVELHGGRVAAHSEGPGLGSEFTVRLPRGGPPGPTADAAPNRGPTCDVLVIGDDADARETLRALLEHEGHRVDVAGDGPNGLARDEAIRPDVVLIDIGLTGFNGYEVAARIRARRAGEPLLVAISGDGSVGNRGRTREAGFDALLTSPVLSADLMAVLAILGHRPPGRAGPRRVA